MFVYVKIAVLHNAFEEGIPMFDINSNCDFFVQCPVLFVTCDNPRATVASEFCHHMGSSATYFCRICEVGFGKDKCYFANQMRSHVVDHLDFS